MSKGKIIDNSIGAAGIIIIFFILLLPCLLIVQSVPLFREVNFFTLLSGTWDGREKMYGVGSFLSASLIIASLSTAVSFVISFGIALFMTGNKETGAGRMLGRIINFMTGIPTVVYGFAGIILLVPFVRKYTDSPSGLCLLSVVAVLSILILPTITIYLYSSFSMVSKKTIMAALSLGATTEQLYRHIIIPSSLRGIAVALILGFSRAVSDTMIPLMLSGNSLQSSGSLFSSARSLTAHIAMELPGEYDGLEFRIIFFAGLILMVLILFFNIIIYYLENKND